MNWSLYFPFVVHQLLSKNSQELTLIHEMEEGIEHRLKRYAVDAREFVDFMEKIKTKRYTWNRLQRLMLYLLLNLTKKQMNDFQLKQGVPFVRVLGFNNKGQELLHQARKQSRIPLVTRIQKEKHPMLDLDMRAASIYQLGYGRAEFNPEHSYHPIKWE